MKSLRWRYSAVLGMLVVVFLFYFSSAHANALYPGMGVKSTLDSCFVML